MNEEYILLSNSVPYEENNCPTHVRHKLVKLLPLGVVHSTKGDFLVDNESFQSIQNKFLQRKLEIPIDYEHQTLKDMQAPAAGWIKDFVLRGDGIYGAVDWTECAAEYLKNKEYRYISPVINIRKEDRKVMGLHSAALTNTPAIDATSAILKSGLLQKISSAEEEFNDMPIEKAGRLFVQLSKAEADRKRTAAAVKKKAELALDELSNEILNEIRKYPDLVADWREVFGRAKKRILDEEGNLDSLNNGAGNGEDGGGRFPGQLRLHTV